MIIVMKEHARESQIRRAVGHIVAAGLDVHRSTGAHRVILGVVGDLQNLSFRRLERMPGVDRLVLITARPEDFSDNRPPRWPGPPLTVGIVGLGQMGGSLALALRKFTPHRVTGFVRPGAPVTRLHRRAVHRLTRKAEEVCAANVVVFATPVGVTCRLLKQWAEHYRRDSLWTDMGSVKAPVMKAAERHLPGGALFIGGHPMAGSERQGIAAADAGLFIGQSYVLTVNHGTSAAAIRRLKRLVKSIGGRPAAMNAETHDRLAAYTSHLPQMVSSALAAAAAPALQTKQGRTLAGPGLRGMTRLASSPADMWLDIAAGNAPALRRAIKDFVREIHGIDTLSSHRLKALFRRAQNARRALQGRR